MVLGRRSRQGAPAPPAMPPSSKAKDYSERPAEVLNELDELRNRGVAKVLNRHFTETTNKIAKEKAEADAALADLQRRRANTSKFVASKGGELNPFDSLYVELQQKRTDCRRKERETMLLYQRYVCKYGKAAKASGPNKPAKEELSPSANSATTAQEAPPSPSPAPGNAPLEPLDENSESAVDVDVNFSKFYNRQISGRSHQDPPTDSSGEALDKPELQIPDLQVLSPQTSRDTANSSDPPERVEETTEPEAAKLEELESNEHKEDSPRSKADPPSDPPSVLFASSQDGNHDESQDASQGSTRTPKAQNAPESPKQPAEAPTSQEPAPVSAAGKDAKAETNEGGSDASDSNRPTKEVTTEMPSAATVTDDEETDDRSIISGLTMNSATTKLVLEEIEEEMGDFIKTETEAIRKMLDQEQDHPLTNSFHNSSASIMGDQSVLVAMKAEAMAREMQQILDNYQKDDPSTAASASVTATEADGDETTSTPKYPHKYDKSGPSADWWVYYDESFQREYYYEKKTNQTQWDAPSPNSRSRSQSQILSGEDVIPETRELPGMNRRKSRRNVYRKRMRKRRNRRFVAFAFVLLCAAGSYVHWEINHAEKTYPEAMEATWKTSSELVADKWRASSGYIADQMEYFLTDRSAQEEAERLQAERHTKLEREMIAKEIERKAAEEAESKAQEEMKRQERLASELKAKEDARKRELELKKKETQKKVGEEARRNELERQEEAERRVSAQQEALHRPWGCNLPLAYIVHSRCRRLAKLNPIYNEDDLVNSFLQ